MFEQVLEFLFQVQHLEEEGCPSDRAELALIANNYNLSETVRYLEILKQLLDLGFQEKNVVEALEKHSNDRDKALESLISQLGQFLFIKEYIILINIYITITICKRVFVIGAT